MNQVLKFLLHQEKIREAEILNKISEKNQNIKRLAIQQSTRLMVEIINKIEEKFTVDEFTNYYELVGFKLIIVYHVVNDHEDVLTYSLCLGKKTNELLVYDKIIVCRDEMLHQFSECHDITGLTYFDDLLDRVSNKFLDLFFDACEFIFRMHKEALDKISLPY